MDCVATIPATTSVKATPTRFGGPSTWPVIDIRPLSACMMKS